MAAKTAAFLKANRGILRNMILSFSNEDKILLHCLKNRFDKKPVQQVSELIGSQLDWQYILETNEKNNISSLTVPFELFTIFQATPLERSKHANR